MRYNLSDDFEEIYLRFSSAEKYLKTARKAFLDDIEVQRVVKRITHSYYSKNKAILCVSGFEFEDILNIANFFALVFTGTKYEARTKHDEIMLLFNFLDQRLSQLVGWVIRKFDTNEIVTSFDPDNCQLPIQSASPKRPIDKALDSLDLINYRISVAETPTRHSALERHKRKIEKKIGEYRKDERAKRLAAKAAKMLARKKLKKNIKKYVNILCYYATVKFVSKDVRKSARLYCTKYGINYIEWAKQRATTNVDESAYYTF